MQQPTLLATHVSWVGFVIFLFIIDHTIYIILIYVIPSPPSSKRNTSSETERLCSNQSFPRCDSNCFARRPQLPDHRGHEGGDQEAQQPVHRPEEVQQPCLLEEEEEEVVYACNSSCMNFGAVFVLSDTFGNIWYI